MSIKNRLLQARKDKGYTQTQVGEFFRSAEKPEGFLKSTVSAWENGVNELTASQIAILCKKYEVTADYLLFGDRTSLTTEEREIIDGYRAAKEFPKRLMRLSAKEALEELSSTGSETTPELEVKPLAILRK